MGSREAHSWQVGQREVSSRFERGSSLAWTAIFLAAVVLPLVVLVAEGSRWFLIRGRLQTATDAACEDAAWSSADLRAYRDGSKVTFTNFSTTLAAAQDTFLRTLGDWDQMGYSASLTIAPDLGAAVMNCTGRAEIRPSFPSSRAITILAQASSAIRYTR